MAVWGYAQGLVVGALSLAGFVGGGFVGSRVGPLLLSGGAKSPYAPVFGLAGAFIVGGVLASALEIVGLRLRGYPRGPLGLIGGAGGAGPIPAAGLMGCRIGGGGAPPERSERGLPRATRR